MTIAQPLIVPGSPGAGFVYLLEIEYPGDFYENGVVTKNLGTVDGLGVSGFAEFKIKSLPTNLQASYERWGTEDVTFLPGDTERANIWYDGRLTNAGVFTRTMSLASVDGSAIVTEFGSITLENSDGKLDAMQDNNLLINGVATLKVGQRGGTFIAYKTAVTAFVKAVDTGLLDTIITFKPDDAMSTELFYDETYGGGGGLDGPEGLTGVRKPYVLGRVFNVIPVLIEPNTYIFQAHAGGALAEVKTVRVAGAKMVFVGNYPDFASLEALTNVQIGEYATCLAEGLIRAGLTQGGIGSFSLTVDVMASVEEAAENAELIIEKANADHGVTYNAPSFTSMISNFTGYIYGRVITDPITYADALTDVMRCITGYWGIGRDGTIYGVPLDPPESLPASTLFYDENDIIDVDRLNLPEGFEWPHSERTLRFRKNWAPTEQLAAIVNNPALSVEYRETTMENAIPHRRTLAPAVATVNLYDRDSARNLAGRLLDLHGVQRQMYVVTFSIFANAPGMTQKVNVKYPRFGLKGGRDMIVVATQENYQEGRIQVTLWG